MGNSGGGGGFRRVENNAVQCWFVRLKASERQPTKTRLTAQPASRFDAFVLAQERVRNVG